MRDHLGADTARRSGGFFRTPLQKHAPAPSTIRIAFWLRNANIVAPTSASPPTAGVPTP